MPPNIVEPSSIYPMLITSVEIQMSLMMIMFARRCGSRNHPHLPTPSFEVVLIASVEINEPSMSSALAPRLGSDKK
ncbi:hypothetical protein J1N35_038432 [Gossypium stocksii]|uniref:Uncharacterized protein n=1 Tax=Gossypium stocksii TaxID=47602 RepID=A0A9D3UM54_9ROSI|nr:hypothetical protein J1N35_038432 [Gossypium stocksii]